MINLPEGTIEHGSYKAFEHYRDLLKAEGVKPKNHTELENGDPTSPEHLLWMCEFCLTKITVEGRGFSIDKFSRWLGYVQGCLICKGFTTVQEERDRTLPWMT